MRKESLGNNKSIEYDARDFLNDIGLEVSDVLVDKLHFANKKLKGKLSTDIDSTEVLSEELAVWGFNRYHNTDYRVEDLKSQYQMVEWSKKIPDVKDPLKHALCFWNNPDWLAWAVDPTPGAVDVSRFLSANGVDVRRETARPGWTRQATLACGKRLTPWVDESLFNIHGSSEINSASKVENVILKSNYHIDDAQRESEVMAEAGVKVVLIRKPWNENYLPKSENLITFDRFYENGLLNLGITKTVFNEVALYAQAYLILADIIIEKYHKV